VSIQDYARQRVGEAEWSAFDFIVTKESGWNYLAKNPNSSATGLCQAMLSLHEVPEDYLTNPQTQVDWCIKYINSRYGSAIKAKEFWALHKWF
jgi:hypothetical protein